MHPYLIEALAAERRRDLLRAARRHRGRPRASSVVPAAGWRIRTGWRLVEIGLRLAVPDRRADVSASNPGPSAAVG